MVRRRASVAQSGRGRRLGGTHARDEAEIEAPSDAGVRAARRPFTIADADAYERGVGRWSRALAPSFVAFCGPIAGTVLDIGCGTGVLTACLLSCGDVERVAGIDVNAELIARARRSIAHPRASFGRADAARLPFADGSFDHALSLLVVNFLPARLQSIREAMRVTRPGGTVAAAIWDFRGGFMYTRFAWDIAAALDPASANERDALLRSPFLRPGSLADLWREAGFAAVRAESIGTEIAFERFDDYWHILIGAGQTFSRHFHTLPAVAQARLRDAVRAAYLVGDDDGPRSWGARAFVVAGQVPA